jgi:hypothetical protein
VPYKQAQTNAPQTEAEHFWGLKLCCLSCTNTMATSYPGLFASAVGWSAKKALASAGLFFSLIGQ